MTISDATSGATIYYTTDGSTPTTNSRVYGGPMTVSASETLQAVATASGYSTSAVGTATYTIGTSAAPPTYSPAGGTFASAQTVTISDATAGATIYYTTDGSTPTTSSSVYTGPITVTSSETLHAIATASGYSPSAVATATYTIGTTAAALPTYSPAGGTFASAQTVTISDATAGATIYYTADGSTPTTSSSVFRGPITVSTSETLHAIATASGYSPSAVATASYNISSTGSFDLTGLTSPATVTESIFVNASAAGAATSVEYYIDDVLVDTQNASPFWMGGGTATVPNGYSTRSLTVGAHKLTASVALSGGSTITSNAVTLEVVPSINSTFSSSLTRYPNQLSAQLQSLSKILANTSTAGATLTPAEINVRQAVLAMYANWGIDPSLDYGNDISAVLASLTPTGWQSPASSTPGAPFSAAFSADAPYYHPVPAQWARVTLPSGYINVVQLNTNSGGDGIGFGESVATATAPNLTVTSEWYNNASTLVTFPYRMQTDWAQQIPTNAAGDKHVIFIDPIGNTFISSYMTSVDSSTGGPDGLYISRPTSFNSLGASGGSVAARMAELPIMIQPGEATNSSQSIRHAISGPVARPWAARVFPATAWDAGILTSSSSCAGSGKTNNGLVPYGGVIQLDPALDLSKLTLTLPARRILEAMQTYGYYVVDVGCGADVDIYTAIPESELEPFGGLYGNANGIGVQNEIQNVLVSNALYVVAPLAKKQ